MSEGGGGLEDDTGLCWWALGALLGRFLCQSKSYLSRCRDVWIQSSKLMGVRHYSNYFFHSAMTSCSDVIRAHLGIQNKASAFCTQQDVYPIKIWPFCFNGMIEISERCKILWHNKRTLEQGWANNFSMGPHERFDRY